MTRTSNSNGLTTLEVVVAIAIWVMVAASITVIFNSALTVFRAASDKTEAITEAQTAAEWLTNELQQGYTIITAETNNITLVGPNQDYISYYWDNINQTVNRRVCAGESYLVAQNITQYFLKYYDVNNQQLSNPADSPLLLKTVEMDITVEKNTKGFQLNAVSRFEYNPDYQWAKAFGGGNSESTYNQLFRPTSDDGYIFAGQTNSFGANGTDILLMKLDASAAVAWAKMYGGSSNEQMWSIRQTADGGYVLGARSNSFGGSNYDYLVIKLTNQGAVDWTKTYGNYSNSAFFPILYLNSSNTYLLGTECVDGSGESNIVLTKINSTGVEQWAKEYGTVNSEQLVAIEETSDGGFLLGGNIWVTANNDFDILLIKTDSSGNSAWEKVYRVDSGTTKDEMLRTLERTNGGFIIGGDTRSFGTNDLLAIKIDDNGTVEWSKRYYDCGSTSDSEYLYSVKQTSSGGYVYSGRSNGAVLVKTNSTGTIEWQKRYPVAFSGYAVQPVSDGGYIVADYTNSLGSWDYFLFKTNSTGGLKCCNITQNSSCVTANVTISTPSFTFLYPAHAISNTTPALVNSTVNITTTNVCPAP